MQYPQDLVNRYKSYMLKNRDHEVTDEQAQLELDSLADLFEAFSELHLNKKPK